ncbi:MAG: Thioesterase family protein [Nevskia sp.]|nr:Thioesterase family protein [Nevskia sp.]
MPPESAIATNPLWRLTPQQAQHIMIDSIPQSHALGLQVLEFAPGRVVVDLPYDARLVGDPDTGVLHGGAITTLVDGSCGAAVMSALRTLRRCATVDLRIDYLRAARPHRTVRCIAECYRVTHEIAFVRATAHDGDPADLLANAAGTFVLFEELTEDPASPERTV